MLAERQYWKQLLAIHPTITAVAKAADVNRCTVYERLKAVGLNPKSSPIAKYRQTLGNEQWQALSSRRNFTPEAQCRKAYSTRAECGTLESPIETS